MTVCSVWLITLLIFFVSVVAGLAHALQHLRNERDQARENFDAVSRIRDDFSRRCAAADERLREIREVLDRAT